MPEKAPERFLVAIEACGGGNPDLSSLSMFLGYVGLYRRKKSVGGASRGPQEWRARPGGGRSPLSCGFLEASLTSTPSLLDCFRSKNNSSEGFHSVWTPFDIPFQRNTETWKKQKLALGSGSIG